MTTWETCKYLAFPDFMALLLIAVGVDNRDERVRKERQSLHPLVVDNDSFQVRLSRCHQGAVAK